MKKVIYASVFAAMASSSVYADCYTYSEGTQEVSVGFTKIYSADKVCITGDYTKDGYSPDLVFSLYQGDDEVASYKAVSERYTSVDIRFTLEDGNPEPTQFDATVDGNVLSAIEVSYDKMATLEPVAGTMQTPEEKYTLFCTDVNQGAAPYRSFLVEFSNAQGPALGDGTKVSLSVSTNAYYGAEMPTMMMPIESCQSRSVSAPSADDAKYYAECVGDGDGGYLSLNVLSNYGLATGTITFPEGVTKLGIPEDTKVEVVCRGE